MWRSPDHTIAGDKIARELLWREFGLAGTKELQGLRECICALIRNHSLTQNYLERTVPERKLIKALSMGELVPDYSLGLLRILVQADLKGRVSDDMEDSLKAVELCFEEAGELGILGNPYPFPSAFTRYSFLSGKKSGAIRSFATAPGEK